MWEVHIYLFDSPDPTAPVALGSTIEVNYSSGLPFIFNTTGTATDSGFLYRFPLYNKLAQTVTIPADLAVHSGQYFLYVSLTAKGSGKKDQAFYSDIFMDNSTVGDAHLDYLRFDYWTSQSGTNTLDDRFMVDSDASTFEIALGNTVASYIHFRRPDKPSERYIYDQTINKYKKLTYDQQSIKVWNATPGVDEAKAKANATWHALNTPYLTGTDVLEWYYAAFWTPSITDVEESTDSSLDLLSGQDNLLRYQTVGANGMESVIRTIIVHPDDTRPELDIRLDSNGSHPVQSVQLFASDTTGTARDIFILLPAELGGKTVVPTEGITLTTNGSYRLLTSDLAGNFVEKTVTINWIDRTAPDLTLTSSEISGQSFSLTAEMTGPSTAVLATEKLQVALPDTYAAFLGYAEVTVPEKIGGGQWIASSDGYGGIYFTDTQYAPIASGYKKTVTVRGVFQHDPAIPGPTTQTLTITALDNAGNTSIPQTIQGTVTTQSTAFIDSTLVNDEVCLNFRVPVVLTNPAGGHPSITGIDPATPTVYGHLWQQMPIYQDGDLPILYTDLFGTVHPETIPISAFGAYGLNVTQVPATATNGPVTVTIAAIDPSTKLALPTTIAGAGSQTLSPDERTATVIMDANGTISVAVTPAGSTPKVRDITVSQIDRVTPAPVVRWFYHEFASNTPPIGVTSTSRPVDVWLEADEPLNGLFGKTTSIVFSYGSITSYTFEYADNAGNVGAPITVTLPIDITTEPVVDTTAPTFSLDLSVYDGVSSSFTYGATVSSSEISVPGTISEVLDLLIVKKGGVPMTGAWLFGLTIRDKSLTRLLIRPGTSIDQAELDALTFLASPPETMTGVEISGTNLIIRDNLAFTLIIIDQNNNRTVVPIETKYVDTIAPTGIVMLLPIASSSGVAGQRSYIALSDNTDPDNANGTVRIISPAGLPIVTDPTSVYFGQTYFDFTANQTQLFLIQDVCGVIAPLSVTVSDLDSRVPAATVDWWSPSLIDSSGQAVRNQPPAVVNESVTVGLSFNTRVTSVDWQIWDGTDYVAQGPYDHYSLNITHDAHGAQITFYDNVDIRLIMTGQNGLVGTKLIGTGVQSLGRDLIDYSPPWFSSTTDEPTDGSKVLSVKVRFFEFSEPFYALDCGSQGLLYPEMAVIEQEIIKNGTYVYRFIDAAGNQSEDYIRVTQIDDIPPEIVVAGLPSATSPPIIGTLTLYATMSEAGFLTFRGVDHAVQAPIDKNGDGKLDANHYTGDQSELNECDWVTLSVPENGSYQLTARDGVGLRFYSYFTISHLDTKAPILHFSPGTLSVRQGTLLAQFEAMRREGVIVQDNVSAPGDLALAMTSLSQSQLDTVGTYSLTYTATDAAGNSRSVQRYVRVYPKDALTVYLNGVKTDHGGTIILTGTRQVSIDIANLPGGAGEPITIFLKAGIRTAGQMKSGAERIDGTDLTFPDDGFYTLYIVTQSRVSYLTYCYIEQ